MNTFSNKEVHSYKLNHKFQDLLFTLYDIFKNGEAL